MAKPPTHQICGTAHWSTEKCPTAAAKVPSALSGHATKDREIVAAWMIANGFATGHSDTICDLLGELTWQVAEMRTEIAAFREKRDKEREAIAERVRKSRERKANA